MTYLEAAPNAAACTLLAREVHDRIGSGIALALRRLDLLEIGASTLAPADRGRLTDLRAALVETLGTAREVTSGLRRMAAPVQPPLEASLREFLRTMAPSGLDVRVSVGGDDRWLPAPVVDEAFVVIREALRNTFAHAGARRVGVDVGIAPHELHAVVSDDGTGFDPALVRLPGRANGLQAMEERVRALDGSLGIASAPGRGTRVRIWVPNKAGVRHG